MKKDKKLIADTTPNKLMLIYKIEAKTKYIDCLIGEQEIF